MPQSSGPGTTQQHPCLSSLQPRQPADVLPWQSAPAWPGHQPRRTLGSRLSGLPASHFHVLWESYPSCSQKWPGPQVGGSLGGHALSEPDSLRVRNWPRGHLKLLPTCTSSMSSCISGQSHLSIGHGAHGQVPLPQLERGPKCWSLAVARAHPGINCPVLPLPVPPAHALALSLPSEGQCGFEGLSF